MSSHYVGVSGRKQQLADLEEIGLGGPTRMESILRQLKDEHVHIFGLKETRVRCVCKFAHSDFILVNNPANDPGHFGMLRWLLQDTSVGQNYQGRQQQTDHAP